jgi:hypothetical protein
MLGLSSDHCCGFDLDITVQPLLHVKGVNETLAWPLTSAEATTVRPYQYGLR